jgi:hypothetical protein
VLLCFALGQESLKIKAPLIGGVLTFWFILTLFERRARFDPNVHIGQLAIDCFLLAAVLAFTTHVVTSAAAQSAKATEQLSEVPLQGTP